MQSVSKRKQTKKCSPSQNNTTYSFSSSSCPPELSVEHSKTRTENQLHPLEKERWDIRPNESPNHTLVGMTPHSKFSSFLSGHPIQWATSSIWPLHTDTPQGQGLSLLTFTHPLDYLAQPEPSVIISIPTLSLNTHQKSLLGVPWEPVVRNQHVHCHGPGSNPGQVTEILKVTQLSQNIKIIIIAITEFLSHSSTRMF